MICTQKSEVYLLIHIMRHMNFRKVYWKILKTENSMIRLKTNGSIRNLKNIKEKIMFLKKNFTKSNQIKFEIKKLKKDFRSWQRYSIYLREQKEYSKLNKISKLKDKNKFWRFINNSKRKRTVRKCISLDPALLLDHYKNLFGDSDRLYNENDIEISNKVKDFAGTSTKVPNKVVFNENDVVLAIKEFKFSLVCGHDGINYTMIKNAVCENFISSLTKMFNLYISSRDISSQLNISIIKPILKDMSKKTDDKNNIRPISISNCFSQIFEKIILQKSPLLLKMHKNQFGFKRHTSCNHAIFVTKETILNYIEKQSSCKIASLDAEKAFDKVWRDGMFLKLIGKLDLDIWLVLKKYYDSITSHPLKSHI